MEPFFIDKLLVALSLFIEDIKETVEDVIILIYESLGYGDIPQITFDERLKLRRDYPHRNHSRCDDYCAVRYRQGHRGICYHGNLVGHIKSKSCGDTTLYKAKSY